MVNAQEYINNYCSQKIKEDVTKLDISFKSSSYLIKDEKKLVGSLKLENFPNLQELDCSTNKLSCLEIMNCPQLKKVCCSNNQLATLNLYNCLNLEELDCS
jgi:Leucine-rich repeat (LRR) protein